jgi:hypothetical protein
VKVEVWPVRSGAALVAVPMVLRRKWIRCVFFVDKNSMRLVRIFGDKSSQGRNVPAPVLRDARERALDALADREPQTEHEPLLAFALDVATVH